MCHSHSIKVWFTCYVQFWKSTFWHQVSITNFETCGQVQPSRMLKLNFLFWEAVNLGNFKHLPNRFIPIVKKKKMQEGLPSVALKPTPVVNLDKENKIETWRATFLHSDCFNLFLDTEDGFFWVLPKRHPRYFDSMSPWDESETYFLLA